MICAEFVDAGASAPVVSPAASQPADTQTCAVVLLTGSDTSALSAYVFPSSGDAGAAWSLGFSLVVGSYCIAWGIGAVLRFIKSA